RCKLPAFVGPGTDWNLQLAGRSELTKITFGVTNILVDHRLVGIGNLYGIVPYLWGSCRGSERGRSRRDDCDFKRLCGCSMEFAFSVCGVGGWFGSLANQASS